MVKLINNFIFNFKPIKKPLLTKKLIETIVDNWKKNLTTFSLSLTLGKTTNNVVINDDLIIFEDFCEKITINDLLNVKCKDDDIFVVINSSIQRLAFFNDNRYYKLKLVEENTAPTLEISGIHMHRISGITPWQDTLIKIRLAKIRPGCKVLDVCTGLGYTAIASILKGANKVISIEKDPNVLRIAQYNPWSWELANEKITILLSDATKVIKYFDDNEFDRIIHDPPHIALAGELYSLGFYEELYRVLKRGGILFHYTGRPGHTRGLDVAKGVAQRLTKVGFLVRIIRKHLAVVAIKP